jgi:hypothetical protein
LLFLLNPEKLLNCSKQFSINRFRNIRWKNRIYFKDNRIKIKNITVEKYENLAYGCGEIWYLNGEMHRNDIDPTTGLTFPTIIEWNESKHWYKEGKIHCDDIDPNTGLTLPCYSDIFETKEWKMNGQHHCDEFDPETGFTLPASVCNYDNIDTWNKNGQYYRDDIDPETGLILPYSVCHTEETLCWHKNVVNIDPDTGLFFPNYISQDDVPENIFNKIYSLMEENNLLNEQYDEYDQNS